jgi:hypothetical protein
VDTRTGNSHLMEQPYIQGEYEADTDSNFPQRRRTIPCHKNTSNESVNTLENPVPEWLRKALKVWDWLYVSIYGAEDDVG